MSTVIQIKLIILYSGILLAIYLIALLLVGPLNLIGRMLLKGLFGGTSIFIFNYLLQILSLDFYIGLNAITSIVTGYLGVFGIVILSCIKYIFT